MLFWWSHSFNLRALSKVFEADLQIDQSLKLIGIPEEYRKDIITQVAKERELKSPINLASYAKKLPVAEKARALSHFEL